MESSTQIQTTENHSNRPLKRFGFLLLDEFTLLPFSGMVDVLRDANYVVDENYYDWCTISIEADVVQAMNHIRVEVDSKIGETPPLDTLVVCTALNGHLLDDSRITTWLRSQYLSGVRIGSIATGTWQLAKAGLLSKKRCTIHWEDHRAFKETYPELQITNDIYEIDGQIFSCSGGTGAIDLFLHFVEQDIGRETASLVAQQIVHNLIRQGFELQPQDSSLYSAIGNRSIKKVLTLMQSYMDTPLSISELPIKCGISQKHMERLFVSHFNQTPQIYYRNIRLQHARTLLKLTTISISEVALSCGFSSSSYLAKCYRNEFNRTPSEERPEIA
jgi:transcriptional regulator GlxA family with amidase domain